MSPEFVAIDFNGQVVSTGLFPHDSQASWRGTKSWWSSFEAHKRAEEYARQCGVVVYERPLPDETSLCEDHFHSYTCHRVETLSTPPGPIIMDFQALFDPRMVDWLLALNRFQSVVWRDQPNTPAHTLTWNSPADRKLCFWLSTQSPETDFRTTPPSATDLLIHTFTVKTSSTLNPWCWNLKLSRFNQQRRGDSVWWHANQGQTALPSLPPTTTPDRFPGILDLSPLAYLGNFPRS